MSRSNVDFESLARFRFVLRRFLAFSDDQARAAGIEPQQHQLLLSLRGLPDGESPTIGALADQLLIRHNSATELVQRMEEKGLVERRTAAFDRRVVLVAITRRGHAVLNQLSRSHRDELRKSGPALAAALQALVSEPTSRPATTSRKH